MKFKSGRKLLRKMLQRTVPRDLRYRLNRHALTLPNPDDCRGLRVKIAHRPAELEQAFALLHDAYVHMGFMSPQESGLRLTKYHVLPSTTTIVAMMEDQVVGTVSLVRDGLFGFPSDSLVDKTPFRKRGVRIAEVSSLAIAKEYRRKSHGAILWPLIAHLVRYCDRYFGIDYFAIAVHPSQFEFYESILFFEKLTTKPIAQYGFVNDNPAMCGIVNVNDFKEQLHLHYGMANTERNLYRYLVQDPHTFLKYPKRDNYKISDPFWTPQLLQLFCKEKTNLFAQLSSEEMAILHSVYTASEYRQLFPKAPPGPLEGYAKRTDARYDVKCEGELRLPTGEHHLVHISNVSKGGLAGRFQGKFRANKQCHLTVAIAKFSLANLEGQVMWNDDNGQFGFRVHVADAHWDQFIANLDRDLKQKRSDHSPFSMVPEALGNE